MFKLVTKYLFFLKYVPGLPHVFDALLRLYTLLVNPNLLICIDEVENEVLTWQHTTVTTHKYGGVQLNYYGTELGHIHSNGLLDMPLSRKLKQQLMAGDKRVQHHHSFTNSGWISVYMQNGRDKKLALALFKTALTWHADKGLKIKTS